MEGARAGLFRVESAGANLCLPRVLVVEDQDGVRRFAVQALSASGCRVFAAADGSEAITLAGGYDGGIDILLTDVVLPGLNGREVADGMKQARPGIKVNLHVRLYPGSDR